MSEGVVGARSSTAARAAVAFDLDMTLIDSRAALLAAFGALAAESGVAIDLDAVDGRLGLKLEHELAFWFEPGALAGAAAAFRRQYVSLAPSSTTLLPGALEAIAAVRAAGVPSAIVTAKHEISATPCLEATGIRVDRVIHHVYGPEKAVVLRDLPARVYVGDAAADMAAAAAAGVVGVGVTTGNADARELTAAGASVVLESLTDFPAWYAAYL